MKTLVQHVKALIAPDPTNGKKRIDYDYDLVSGKVNKVSYQHGKGDQFYYKYGYDADNRVVSSYSSRDELLWTEDASYTYYLHGPLARTELGGYKVQGVDYAYTLQGWLKGINSDTLSPAFDMAHDGKSGMPFGRVSRDVYGFTLGYYGGDYKPIDIANATAFSSKVYNHPTSPGLIGDSLFNGNISYTTLALSRINNGATTGYSYGYDQLNRLIKMRQHTTGTTSGWSNSTILTQYAEDIAYDANGNILKYLRKGTSATLDMDSLSYKYNRDVDDRLINNRLNHVRDHVSAGNYTVDIDDQSSNNYTYDHIGNLRRDVAEGIDTVRWTVYGKINRIVKSSGDVVIDYAYDAAGNRTSKQVNDDGTIKTTYYVRDAQGNVMGIYSKKGSDAMKWEEQHLYGSSRLGMWRWDTIVPTAPPVVLEDDIYDSVLVGNRNYELSNHLGNVLATISDKKIGNDSSGVVNYYIAEVLSQNDYYPFGMLQPGRQYSAGNGYRYGFNGKENDNEVKGEGNQQDYGMRIYDPRLRRFLSVDPLSKSYPWYTPYQFAGNKPIWALDLDGAEEWYYYNNLFGWTPSKLFSGPFTEKRANELGYHSAAQVHSIEKEKKRKKDWAKREEIVKESNEAVKTIQRLNNPITLAYELSPLSEVPQIVSAIDEESYVQLAVSSVIAVTDISPLFRAVGSGYAKIASNIASKFTFEGIWNIGNNLARGALIEAKVASKYIGKGIKWMAEISPFFNTYDFYDDTRKIAISLKSVNSKSNFDFTNIMENIESLKNLKGSANAQFGQEFFIKEVQLDIAIPKGYDQRNLKNVIDKAENAGVNINIFEATD